LVASSIWSGVGEVKTSPGASSGHDADLALNRGIRTHYIVRIDVDLDVGMRCRDALQRLPDDVVRIIDQLLQRHCLPVSNR
jgi:hypothetical protein